MGLARWLRTRLAYQQGLLQRFWGHRTLRRVHYEAAVRSFSQALTLRSDFINARLDRGLVYWRELQEYQLAIADFSQVLRLDPGRIEALFFRSMAYQNLGDYASALADLRVALARGEGADWHHDAYRQLAALEPILDELKAGLGAGEVRPLLPDGHD